MSLWWKVQGACFLLCLLEGALVSSGYPVDETDYLDGLPDDKYISLAKRFMGIFRCNGWGPGCSHLQNGAGGQLKVSSPLTEGVPLPRIAPQVSQEGIGRSQPYFTLTSGESWGPTGKRTASPPAPFYSRRLQRLFSHLEHLKSMMLQLQST